MPSKLPRTDRSWPATEPLCDRHNGMFARPCLLCLIRTKEHLLFMFVKHFFVHLSARLRKGFFFFFFSFLVIHEFRSSVFIACSPRCTQPQHLPIKTTSYQLNAEKRGHIEIARCLIWSLSHIIETTHPSPHCRGERATEREKESERERERERGERER